jgi:hypothetical protein
MADLERVDGVLRREAIERLLEDAEPGRWSSTSAYRKWQGAHWRLVSLVELGEREDPRMHDMLEHVLRWLTGPAHVHGVQVIDGRARRCASQEGNALFVASRMGRASSAALLAENLVEWQWPDGGWNCDQRHATTHSSFHETVWPLRGLIAYHEAVGEPSAWAAAERAAEFLLRHRLFRSVRSGTVIDPEWLHIHWPPYWRYDVLQGLRVLDSAGFLWRAETVDALAWLRACRRDDGTWRTSGRRWWRAPGSRGSGVEVVDWDGLDDEVVTAQAEGVLRSSSQGSGPSA